ncbi:aspartate-semialdehyde dehydrogenase [Desulfosoma caldarium]|uniref:Aspartate-semialdehyde dehydrogenase n=1 Tax=Desulfosoma caldarium TaxID=610254 RepID=A0A3N1UWP0_9BACT|nr:aspartate-semialdehyde dehydrogenase [Desulfosoma caldarium]ROQ92341.1 aspartate semialdehyde dehydrogenase [Desulfosoma caldarium]
MSEQGYRVAVVGATGAVGTMMIKVLEERNFPVASIKALASSRSVGKKVPFRGKMITVEELTERSFDGVQLALFSAGATVSRRFAPMAARAGCVVVDNSSAFRMEPHIPLVVPEVNPNALQGHPGIIANPNCSTIQMVVALKPIQDAARIKRIVVTTFQAVSGTGQKAVFELEAQVQALLQGRPLPRAVYPHQIAFNCLPHIGAFLPTGYTEEEMKMVNETRKIFEDASIQVCATTVRVPVYYGHSESVAVETHQPLSVQEARDLLKKASGVVVVDDPAQNEYPMPLNAAGRDETFVGRLRKDFSVENGLVMWIVADNIRKGAATNAVQIAEILVKQGLLRVP